MKRKSLFLFLITAAIALVALLPVTQAQAAEVTNSGKCGTKATWTLDKNGTLTISGTGPMNDYTVTTIPWYACRTSVKHVVIQEGITYIGNHAFLQCHVSDVTLPSSITSIGEQSFGKYLKPLRVYITDIAAWCRIKMFNEGSNPLQYDASLYLQGELVTELTIPESIPSIAPFAFFGCDSLTRLTVEKGVEIGEFAFNDCSHLTDVDLHEGVKINRMAFTLCAELTNLRLAEGITEIGEGAFMFCRGLTEVKLPRSITRIRKEAFRACSNLTSISIPESVTSIESKTFEYCEALTQIAIPASVTRIKELAFNDCTSLTHVRFAGTEDQWNAIEILWNNELLIDAAREYNYVDPETQTALPPESEAPAWLLWLKIAGGVLLAGGSVCVVLLKKSKP